MTGKRLRHVRYLFGFDWEAENGFCACGCIRKNRKEEINGGTGQVEKAECGSIGRHGTRHDNNYRQQSMRGASHIDIHFLFSMG